MNKTSEFGKGLTYCLGLFLAHTNMHTPRDERERKYMRACTWFNASSDHLYEMQIPDTLPKSLQNRLRKFRKEMLDLGHGSGLLEDKITWKQVTESLETAKSLLLAIDKHYGIATKKASWG